MERADVVIAGAGILGLATAYSLLQQRPELAVLVVDKEHRVAAHQTGRNSGVIHSGIYYKPGSLKAQTCTAGRNALLAFCSEFGVTHEVCGKVIVATRPEEIGPLDELERRAAANGVPAERIDRARLRELEPHCEGVAALHVPATGIVDFVGMCRVMAEQIGASGSEVRMNTAVTGVTERTNEVIVETSGGEVTAQMFINCAGLQSDRLATMSGANPDDIRIMPFRGEYYELVPERRDLVRNLIYPVPDPRFPFLGVHYTRMFNGEVHAGPNAVAAFKREGYGWKAIDLDDAKEILQARSSWDLLRKYWKTGAGEVHRSVSKKAFVKALQGLIPAVREEDLMKGEAGVRAQAITPDGTLLDDFALGETNRTVQVINAPSPAATASLEIGRSVAENALTRI